MGDLHPPGGCQSVWAGVAVLNVTTKNWATLQQNSQMFSKYLFLIDGTTNVFTLLISEETHGRRAGWGKTQRKVGVGESGQRAHTVFHRTERAPACNVHPWFWPKLSGGRTF